MATQTRKAAEKAAKPGRPTKPGRTTPALFVRQVVAELRKVIWPTRKELITYTAVVVGFVTIMLTVVGLLDFGFAKVILWVFGNKTTAAGK